MCDKIDRESWSKGDWDISTKILQWMHVGWRPGRAPHAKIHAWETEIYRRRHIYQKQSANGDAREASINMRRYDKSKVKSKLVYRVSQAPFSVALVSFGGDAATVVAVELTKV